MINSSYLLFSFLLSTSTILFSVMFFAMRIPREENMKRYNIARYVLAVAYLSIGVFNCYKTFIVSIDNVELNLIRTLTLVSASYQALLFTFTLLILIQPAYVSMKRISVQFGIISFVLLSLLLLLNVVSSAVYSCFYNIASAAYVSQLIYYTFLFRRKYVKCVNQLKEYYNEDEDDRLRWVKVFFYIALSVGVITLFMTFLPLHYYKYFIPAIILFYIFFAIKYYNYPLDFHYITSAVYADDTVPPLVDTDGDVDEIQPMSDKEKKLQEAIDKWVEEKQFISVDMSRDDIAKSLGTDRDFLAIFFHNRMKTEFRIWRTQLRIEEAKELLLKYPDLSVSKIGDRVGIADRSNFRKIFIELVGVSPGEWRESFRESK